MLHSRIAIRNCHDLAWSWPREPRETEYVDNRMKDVPHVASARINHCFPCRSSPTTPSLPIKDFLGPPSFLDSRASRDILSSLKLNPRFPLSKDLGQSRSQAPAPVGKLPAVGDNIEPLKLRYHAADSSCRTRGNGDTSTHRHQNVSPPRFAARDF